MSDDKKVAGTPPPNAAPEQPGARPSTVAPESADPLFTDADIFGVDTSGGHDAPMFEIGAAQLKDMIGALQSELDKKAAEAAEKHDQFVRAVAETENVRRRLEKEKDEVAKYAISKFAKDILSIGDNFQRAISAVSREAAEADPHLQNLLDGVVLAEREFKGALERHGVRALDPTGLPFNPHHHQAVMEEENAGVANGTVLKVFQVGYLLDERCLRPAMVVVSRGGPKAVKAGEQARAEPPSDGGSESGEKSTSDGSGPSSGA
ncbi:MAG: nucleotide exchange factor GrpE [Hyphomicrobium sp.]